MHLNRTFTYKTDARENPGDTLARILPILRSVGWDDSKLYLLIDGGGATLRNTAITRVLKAYPELVPFYFKGKRWSHEEELSEFISTCPTGYQIAAPIGAPTKSLALGCVMELLHGIPRRFPFWSATVICAEVPTFDLRGPDWSPGFCDGMPGFGARPELVLESRWSSPRRSLNLVAGIPSLAPPLTQSEFPLPAATKDLLKQLGTITKVHSSPLQTPDMVTRQQELDRQFDRLKEAYSPIVLQRDPAWAPPRTLPSDRPDESWLQQCVGPLNAEQLSQHAPCGVPLSARALLHIPSIKELLLKWFKPLGYRYNPKESGRGCYQLEKLSPLGNRLQLNASASPNMGQWHASLVLSRFGRCISLPLLVGPWGDAYPINQHIEDVVINAAAAAAKLEQTAIPEADALFGIAPAWMARMNRIP